MIIVGMHRSGTSLAASLLESAGVHVGERLMEANWSNPRGHFEDMDFVDLQRAALERLGLHRDGWVESDLPALPEDIIESARALVERKRKTDRPWGWKDPRTIVFLQLWLELLPDAKLILLYRAPWEVIDSLYRRGDQVFQEDPELAVRMWLRYNRVLLDALQARPSQCLLVSLETVAAHPGPWVARVGELAGVHLAPPRAALYDDALLHGSKAAVRAGSLFRHYPEVVELYAALQSRAWHPPGVEPTPPWARCPTVDAERRLAIADWQASCSTSAAGGPPEEGEPSV